MTCSVLGREQGNLVWVFVWPAARILYVRMWRKKKPLKDQKAILRMCSNTEGTNGSVRAIRWVRETTTKMEEKKKIFVAIFCFIHSVVCYLFSLIPWRAIIERNVCVYTRKTILDYYVSETHGILDGCGGVLYYHCHFAHSDSGCHTVARKRFEWQTDKWAAVLAFWNFWPDFQRWSHE